MRPRYNAMRRFARHLCTVVVLTGISIFWMFVVTIATFTFQPKPAWYGPMSWAIGFSVPVVLVVLYLWHLAREVLEISRSRVGYCTTCGYDLRATLDRCPECGTPRPQAA